MIRTPLRLWNRWTRRLAARRPAASRLLTPSLPLRMENLEGREVPATLFGLTENNQLVRFDSAAPGTVTTVAVTGLGGGETLLGLDFRPADEKLYGITNIPTSVWIDENDSLDAVRLPHQRRQVIHLRDCATTDDRHAQRRGERHDSPDRGCEFRSSREDGHRLSSKQRAEFARG